MTEFIGEILILAGGKTVAIGVPLFFVLGICSRGDARKEAFWGAAWCLLAGGIFVLLGMWLIGVL